MELRVGCIAGALEESEYARKLQAATSIHWSLPDPAAIPDADARRRAFVDVATALQARISEWLVEASGRPRPAADDARGRV